MVKKVQKLPILDLLVRRYPEYDREALRAYIDCRQVRVDNETCVDPKSLYPLGSQVELVLPAYVSRGGLKLEHALRHWNLDVSDLVMLDAGSSTGGFTDCLLQHGALAVHAVDVGYNQLDYRLRVDDRVHVHERKNIMHVTELDPQPDAAVADLSFRSITGAASHILRLTTRKWMVSLIKPQFEVPKGTEGFHGVVDDAKLLREILMEIFLQLSREGVGVTDIIESPILGRKGNREFLALLDTEHGCREEEFVLKVGRFS